ncbi:MAG TPA: signal peptidase II, partial [Longimicrobiaceae bacterium]|nr:signal peptidase II [Longimicrobiaceae bacterium]
GRKALLYGGITGLIVGLDQLTKYIALQLLPPYQPVQVLGDFFRLTFIYNPGAAFGLHVGALSRYIFLTLTIACVIVLYVWFRATPVSDRLRLIAISLVTAGAVGNFIDRVRSSRGVIDFLDMGIGDLRWPVFNIADIGVTIGAVLLAISLWREDQEADKDDG